MTRDSACRTQSVSFACMKYVHLYVLAAMAAACGDEPQDVSNGAEGADEVRIVYQGRLDGEFEPCG